MPTYDQLRSFEIFKSAPDEFVRQLSAHAILVSCAKGDFVLQEGQLNDRLRILVSGQVEVRVNNEKVATLSQPGDLMGEMSALAGRAVTASIIALSDSVSFFEVAAAKLDHAIKQTPFGYQLYSVLTQHLSGKIIATNDKARQFEIANRTLVDLNKNLDQKAQERTDAVFKQLMELQDTLMPLRELLADIASRGGPVEEAFANVTTATDMLKHLSDQFSTERSMRSRRVLVAEPDRKQQTIARMALGGTGVTLEAVASADEALTSIASIANGAPDLIFVSSALSESVPKIIAAAPKTKIVYMIGSDLAQETAALKVLSPLLSNIVSRHAGDRMFTVKNITTTVTKLMSKDLFGLEKYMMWGVEAPAHAVTSSGDRARLIELMSEQFKQLGVRGTVVDRAALVAEELLMNAIYDAPVDNGKHHYEHLPRTTEVVLNASEQGQFRFAADGMLAAVSVSDPFGAFEMKTLLNYLERNSQSKGESVQMAGKGGAGRGLHQIISSSDLVVFNVRKNKKTEVIAFFNLDPSAKDELPRSFHFFSE